MGWATDGLNSSLEVSGRVRATGPAVRTPIEDELFLAGWGTVDGTVGGLDRDPAKRQNAKRPGQKMWTTSAFISFPVKVKNLS